MLAIYRRHRKNCSHRGEGRRYRRCKCPIWVDGHLNGVEIRKALGLKDWGKAQELIRKWEVDQTLPLNRGQDLDVMTLEKACEEFERDARTRGLQESTLRKYGVLFRQMQGFGKLQGVIFLKQLDLNLFRRFRESWTDGGISALKKLERLKAFLRFSHESGWITENPSKKINNPKVRQIPTLPYTQEEMIRILAACEKYRDRGVLSAKRVRAFILFLRYSGLRIGDAATCPKNRLIGDRLFLYTQKTGVPVNVKLPSFLLDQLDSLPSIGKEHFFWTGVGTRDTVAGNWRRSLRKVFKLAGIKKGHPHRFRDTFAVELLLAGVSLEHVSVLLGHSSVRITERHYSPWIRARQEQLDTEIQRSWALDPIVIQEGKGTQRVREKNEAVN